MFASSLSDTVSLFVWHMLHPETRVERVRGFGEKWFIRIELVRLTSRLERQCRS